MACLLVPGALGACTTAMKKKFKPGMHVNWLNTMLWGGTIALIIEHIAHQEIVPFPPFLTAMSNPADTVVMLKELLRVGVPMTLGIVAAWVVMVWVYEKFILPSKNKWAHALALK